MRRARSYAPTRIDCALLAILKEDTPTAKKVHSTKAPVEHGLLIAVDWRPPTPASENGAPEAASWAIADSMEELARLTETAGIEVVGAVTQKLSRPVPGTYVGKGKLQEIKELQGGARLRPRHRRRGAVAGPAARAGGGPRA